MSWHTTLVYYILDWMKYLELSVFKRMTLYLLLTINLQNLRVINSARPYSYLNYVNHCQPLFLLLLMKASYN